MFQACREFGQVGGCRRPYRAHTHRYRLTTLPPIRADSIKVSNTNFLYCSGAGGRRNNDVSCVYLVVNHPGRRDGIIDPLHYRSILLVVLRSEASFRRRASSLGLRGMREGRLGSSRCRKRRGHHCHSLSREVCRRRAIRSPGGCNPGGAPSSTLAWILSSCRYADSRRTKGFLLHICREYSYRVCEPIRVYIYF